MSEEKREPEFKIGDVVQETCADEMREVRGIKNKPGWLGSPHDLKYRYKLGGKRFTVKEKDLRLICRWEDRSDVTVYKERFSHLMQGSAREA